MEARRSVRAKGNICRTAGSGQETGRLWVSDFFFVTDECCSDCFLHHPHNDTLRLALSPREEWPSPMTPPQPYRTGQYSSALTNALHVNKDWHHLVVTDDFVSPSAGSTPLRTAWPPTGWWDQPPSPHTCIHLCPPTRYWRIFRPSKLGCQLVKMKNGDRQSLNK